MRTRRASVPVVVLEMDLTEGRNLIHLLRLQKIHLESGKGGGGSIIAEHIKFIDDVCCAVEKYTERMAGEL